MFLSYSEDSIDVLSLVMKLNEQSSLKISADKDNRLLLFNKCIKKIR